MIYDIGKYWYNVKNPYRTSKRCGHTDSNYFQFDVRQRCFSTVILKYSQEIQFSCPTSNVFVYLSKIILRLHFIKQYENKMWFSAVATIRQNKTMLIKVDETIIFIRHWQKLDNLLPESILSFQSSVHALRHYSTSTSFTSHVTVLRFLLLTNLTLIFLSRRYNITYVKQKSLEGCVICKQ